nr:MAG TPA: hypothetical protein [Caudoviricetes sp.]
MLLIIYVRYYEVYILLKCIRHYKVCDLLC